MHSSILAWRIPWTEESDGPQSMGSQSDLARTHALIKQKPENFHSEPVVKNPCLPVQGHGFYPWSWKIPHAVRQLSLSATITEAGAPSAMRSQDTATREKFLLDATRESQK